MLMHTGGLMELCKNLDAEREKLELFKTRLASCELNGYQSEITVTVGNAKMQLKVTELDRGYASRVIRGREIILLGVKKTIAAMVDDQTRVVKDLETQINEACVSKC